jgi:hypothetical protein
VLCSEAGSATALSWSVCACRAQLTEWNVERQYLQQEQAFASSGVYLFPQPPCMTHGVAMPCCVSCVQKLTPLLPAHNLLQSSRPVFVGLCRLCSAMGSMMLCTVAVRICCVCAQVAT